MMASKQNILSQSLITPALAAKMKVFFQGIDPSAQVKYKHLFSTLQEGNEKKAHHLLSLTSKVEKMSRPQSMDVKRNKFMRISANESVDRSVKHSMFDSFEESYLSEKMVSDSLQKQFLEYENSLLRLKNNIKHINIQINKIKIKQPLYDKLNTISRFQKISSMYIVNKAQNELKKVLRQKQELTFIQADMEQKQQVERTENIHHRNQMEDRITRLKLKKVSTKQELKRLTNQVIVYQEESDIVAIINCFEKLLDLFGEKEENYENIKLETCVKIGKPLKRSSVMSEEKIKEIIKINNFEEHHKIKVSSMNNIIESIYTSLKSLEEELNFKYDELLLIKDDKVNDLDLIRDKIAYLTDNQEDWGVEQGYSMKKYRQQSNEIMTKMEFMKGKGRFWVEFTQFWRALLIKISNTHRHLQFPSDDSRIKQQIQSYFIKYGHHSNTNSQAPTDMIQSLLLDHFEGKLPREVILSSIDTFLSDWKSSYYLKQENIEEQISRLPSAMSPQQQLYTLLDHLIIQSGESFRLFIGQSSKLFISCYHLLNARKPLFSVKYLKQPQKKYQKIVKEENDLGASENNIKEQLQSNKSIELEESEKPKEYYDRVMIELLKMAAAPIGDFSKGKKSKRGCFY